MNKVIVDIDNTGNLIDKNGSLMANAGSFTLEPYEEKKPIAELVALGVKVDEILKLKAAGLM